ncbi:uncharacterized protein, partial [Haliotis cracherodii]|uniref:uncharacterized protein n=1 Tax=Haliotis cracherodii TaxID=6455 RepID=UPI0039E7E91F
FAPLSLNPQNERQFLVSETSLAKILQFCSHQSSSSSFSIRLSRGCAAQVLRIFRCMKMPIFNMDTFINIQLCNGVPSCLKVWNEHQSSLLANVGGKPLVWGGDGRCDSPGHFAKYGTDTLMDLRDRRISDIQLVQVSKNKSVQWSEDHHVSVKKYMREDHKDKKHYFDVWYMSKGVGKKLEAATKKSGCAAIRPCITSTTNHMYWVAASCKDDPDMKVDKWLIVKNMFINFVFIGSNPYKAFMEVVSSGYLARDLPNLSPVYQA